MSRRGPELNGGTVQEREAAARWLADHAAEIPPELPRNPEAIQRGHRGHSYAVDIERADTLDHADACEPCAWLVAAETLLAMSRGGWHRDALDEAMGEPRRPGWRGRQTAQRTAERRRAQQREAETAGQLSLAGWGWVA